MTKDWRKMEPILRKLSNGKWEASVGTGFETCWWPEGIGDTPEEAIKNLKKRLMKPVFVIMVTYRRFEHFKNTLERLLPTLPQGSQVRVVYNCEGNHESDQQYSDFFGQLPDNVRVLDTGSNDGWGSSINEGLGVYPEWKDFEYILESNNDVSYEPDWCQKAQELMEKYPKVGVLALWRHLHHGTIQDYGDLLRRDNGPATAWFFRSADLQKFLPFREHGPTKTRGGNGEDVAMTHTIMDAGYWIASPKDDLAHHMDGYDVEDLGKENPAYL